MEHPTKMDDLGYPYFRKPPFLCMGFGGPKAMGTEWTECGNPSWCLPCNITKYQQMGTLTSQTWDLSIANNIGTWRAKTMNWPMNDEFSFVRELWYTQTIPILENSISTDILRGKSSLRKKSQTRDHLDWGFPLTFGIWSISDPVWDGNSKGINKKTRVNWEPYLVPSAWWWFVSGKYWIWTMTTEQLFASFEYFQTLSHKNIIYLLKAPSSHNLFTTRDDNGPAEKFHDSKWRSWWFLK